jgi:hypothetical protein
VRLLAADAIDSLPADLLKELPGFAARVAALRLPLDVAAALGDTEEERAAADVLASQSALLEYYKVKLVAAAAQRPQEFALACEALARPYTLSPSDAAAHAVQEREADVALWRTSGRFQSLSRSSLWPHARFSLQHFAAFGTARVNKPTNPTA